MIKRIVHKIPISQEPRAKSLNLETCSLKPEARSSKLKARSFLLKANSQWRKAKSLLSKAHSSWLITHGLVLLAVTFTLVFQSCQKAVSEQELINYIKNPENGVLIQKEAGSINYKVYYRPSDLLVNQELRAYETKTDSLINYYSGIYHKNLYFMVSISQNNQEVLNAMAGNKQQFGSMVNQLAFGMDQKVTLITSVKDTLHLLDYVYPRTYGLGNSTDMLFAFEKEDINQTEWIQLKIEDFGLQTGDVRFKFFTQDIRKTPTLKFE